MAVLWAYRTLVVTLDRLYKKGLVRRERANRFNAYGGCGKWTRWT